MVPSTAVGLVPRSGSLDLPVRLVRLVAIPEGALRGFTDEVFDPDHATYAEELAIDVPGEETAILSELAPTTSGTASTARSSSARRPGQRSVPCGATSWAHIACQRCAATRSTGRRL